MILKELRKIGASKMKIGLSGPNGLIGNAVQRQAHALGHGIVKVTRLQSRHNENDVVWDPESDRLNPSEANFLENLDCFIHLAGENIASGRWTEDKKKKIKDSRVQGTANLVKILSRLKNPPKALLSASAIGFYGNRGSETLSESSANGAHDFLSEVCRLWELSANNYKNLVPSARVVNLRFGVVIARDGGALATMLTPFKLGLGGTIGDGHQFMSWIDLEDAARSIIHCAQDESITGPVNIVAPHPVTNSEYTRALGSVISRPTIFPMPDFAARLVFGQMADELLLSSTRVLPEKLQEYNHIFKYPQIEDCLKHALGSNH